MGLSVRAVFFDLDNTLIDTAGASRKGMLEVMPRYPQPSPGSLPFASSLLRLPGAPGCGIPQGTRNSGLCYFETPTREPRERVGGPGGCLPSSLAAGVPCLSARRLRQAGLLKFVPALWDPERCH